MITREAIDQRKETLVKDINAVYARKLEAEKLLETLNGALQDCDYWLTQLEEKDA